ncbi:hypothetical protein LTS08_003738 [Lithohypha guttulata]|nr:hypothetical protein LTS08_003738 [Lithohypha guttulata]
MISLCMSTIDNAVNFTDCTTMPSNGDAQQDPRIIRALERSLELGETGIAVAAYYRGKKIIDAVAGVANAETGEKVTRDTLFPVFSVTKGVVALAVHLQAERGLIDLNERIAKYWPAFGRNGKETITIEQALSHRAGVPQMPKGVTPELMANWEWMIKQIESFTPIFPPGEANAYHILVWGWIVGEVVRRTDPQHRPVEQFVYDEICKPIGAKNFFLGVPDTELQRVAKLSGGNDFVVQDDYGICPRAVFPGSEIHNTRIVQQGVDPGAGAITTASAVAAIFGIVAGKGQFGGHQFLSPERVEAFAKFREGAYDQDKILPIPVWFGAAGYWLGGEPTASDPLVGDHREIVYSPGAGGSLAWADFRKDLAVAICHNNMDTPMILEPERTYAPIVQAIREIVKDLE